MRLLLMFLLVSGGILLPGCGGREEEKLSLLVDLASALELSGGNRPELERVLEHYRHEQPDPLKLKAAEYLICNMVAHYTVGGEVMDRLKLDIDTTFRDQPAALRLMFYLIAARIAQTREKAEIEYDLRTISSDFLIRNIERSFTIWEGIKRHYDLSCEDFFKYILPYRINNEPLIDWKDSAYYHLYHLEKGEQLSFGLKDYVNYILAKTFNANSTEQMKTQLSDTLFKQHSIDCIDRAYIDQVSKQLFGIPVAVDFVPHYPTQENRHYWTIIRDRRFVNGKYNTGIIPYTAKVYRRSSYINEIPQDEDNFVPRFIRDPYKTDVTEEYENVTSLEYRFKQVESNTDYAYLCVFNNRAWNEVAWTRLHGRKARFDKIGRDIVYLPCYYNGSRQMRADYPMWVKTDGEAVALVPDKDSLQTLHLTRKFTYNTAGDYYGAAIIGIQIQATNDLKAIRYDSISEIRHYEYMAFDTLYIHTRKKYKYWLLKKVRYSYPELASVKFIQGDSILMPVNTFDIDALGVIKKNTPGSQNIFNDELLDSGTLLPVVGVEFEQPVAVDVVKYITRNDKNGIYPGHVYELFYFDRGEWVSLGEKTATADYIEFDRVPSGALYWLRNRTEGKEERPFTVTGGRVRFW